MNLGIQGKWALVAGASKGLGFGCAKALAQAGVNLVINARTPDTLQTACEVLKGLASDGAPIDVIGIAADITTPQGRAAVFAAPGGPGYDFDIVVTNAGGPPPGDFRDWDRTDWISALDANMLTPIELI